MRFWFSTGFCALLLGLLGSCSTPSPRPEVVRVEVPAVVRDLDSDSLAPIAQAAYLETGTLNIEVRSDGTIHYQTVSTDRILFGKSETRPVLPSDNAEAPAIAVMDSLPAQNWDPETGLDVPVFDLAYWQRILDSVQASITPTDRRYGSVVNVLDEQDLFHYYDEFGTLRTVPLVFKPDAVRVKDTYRLDQVVAQSMPRVRQMVTEGDDPPLYALLNTGDESEGGYPFVFLDFGQQRAFFLRSMAEEQLQTEVLPMSTTIETAGHLTTSHVRVIVEQPVSALTRLFTLATRSTSNMLDPRGRLPIAQEPVPSVVDRPGMDLDKWEARLDEMTGQPAPKGHITTLIDGEEFFPRLIDSISGAKDSLRLRTYIFDNDDYAFTFAELLKRRSTDIDIRVMVDGLGTISAAAAQPEYQPPGTTAGGPVLEYLTSDSNVEVRMLANPWLTGDHTKSIIVDDRIAFVGGMNIGREYRYEWHDLMFELSGPVVDVLRKDFDKTWTRQRPLGDFLAMLKIVRPVNPETDDMYPVRVLTTSPKDTQILKAQIAAIRASQQRIYIQNAYFTSDAILYELVMARRRGVDVRVILPLRSDFGLIDRANAIAANKMIANGIRVFIYPKMSHVKGAIYDGWACLGSANFDALSLQVNQELNIATSHPPFVEDLMQRVFLADMENSVELTEPFPSQWHDFLTGLIADIL
ncbi:MAG: phosphatidylserine/phosphatidylglycerophosphate/cardiolipin synthase family protein [Betaproteobacteria bacterium]|nr:MAG: phosphatidylserine/phosphatidylglycerophosphate/cardiolipin synthase family protein [Betaproteobacteria bacterium]